MKAAIFDMDGTLLDSMGVWRGLGEAYLLSFGITPPEGLSDTIRPLSFYETAQYLKAEFHINATPEEMIAAWNEIAIEKYRDSVTLKLFVKEYLEFLEKQGVKMCVATATDKKIAEEILKKHGILPYFAFVITEEEVGMGKTSPEIFIKAADRLQENICDCVVFEDAYHAIKSAKTAGFIVYAIEDDAAAKHKDEIIKICDKYITSEEIGEMIHG